jgi:hypothetical protein
VANDRAQGHERQLQYRETKVNLKAQLRKLLPYMEQYLLQHAGPQMSAKTTAEFQRLGFTVLDHPVSLGFHLLPRLKENVRGHQHASGDESRQRLSCGSVIKMHKYIVTYLRNFLKVCEIVHTTKIIMSRN